MSHHIDIDLSNRLEDSGPTFLAYANHLTYVIKIPSKVKQSGLILLQGRDMTKRQAKPLLWTACLFLLLQPHLAQLRKTVSKLVIDNEFDGHQALIKGALLRYIWRTCRNFPEEKITIASIGKKSAAHVAVWQAKKGKRPVNGVIKTGDLLKILG